MEVQIHGQTNLNDPDTDILTAEHSAPEVIFDNSGDFGEEIFDNLPEILKRGTDVLTGNDKQVYLVSALAAISSVLPKYQTIYDNKPLWSNLYVFLIGAYGSGKGAAVYAHIIARLVHKAKRESEPPPNINNNGNPKQTRIVHFIPANASKSGLIELLANNGNSGYIHETEADTLTSILKQDYGDFSDLLRKAYQHEAVTFYRRKDNEYHEVEEPKLSILLTGTPGQLRKLIPNHENGLLSRFCYFNLKSEALFKNVFDQQETDLTRYFYEIAQDVLTLWQRLHERTAPVNFSFTEPQEAEFLDYFQGIKTELIESHGEFMAGVVNRFGVQFTRLAMILTALRSFDGSPLRDFYHCQDIDFSTTKAMMEVFILHALDVFNSMAANNIESLPESKRSFYNDLPGEFRTHQAVGVAATHGISERTAKRFIENKELFAYLRHGHYKKLK